MKLKCPKLLITTGKGKERQAIEEVVNILFEYDSEAYGVKTVFDGVVLVYTSLDPKFALNVVKKKPTSVIFKVVPLEACVKTSLESIVHKGLELARKYISEGDTFIVDCIRRGRLVQSSVVVERALGKIIAEKLGGIVSFKNPKYIVRVEIVGEITGISVLKRDEILRRRGRGGTVK